jgi:hypothetical protein
MFKIIRHPQNRPNVYERADKFDNQKKEKEGTTRSTQWRSEIFFGITLRIYEHPRMENKKSNIKQ